MLRKIPYLYWIREKIKETRYDLARTGLSYFNKTKNYIPQEIEEKESKINSLRSFLSKEYGFPRKNFLVTPGATYSNYLIYLYFQKRAKKFLIEKPTYQPLILSPRSLEIEIERLERSKEDCYMFDKEEIKEKISKESLVIISNRHNPSGQLLGHDELKALSEIVEEKDSYLLVDEVYSPYGIRQRNKKGAFGGPTALNLPNSLITNSMTKFFGMGGLRIGWLGGDREIIKETKTYTDHFHALAEPSKNLAKKALLHKKELIREANSLIKNNNKILREKLKNLGFEGEVYGKNTFGFFKHKEIKTKELIQKALEQDILIVPGKFFEKEDYIRISAAEKPNKAKKSLEKLEELIKQH